MSEIESVLNETRSFVPTEAFRSRARLRDHGTYDRMYRESIEDPEGFWGRVAGELPWIRPFDQVLDWSAKPFARWFVGGKINASAVCIDRHIKGKRIRATLIGDVE